MNGWLAVVTVAAAEGTREPVTVEVEHPAAGVQRHAHERGARARRLAGGLVARHARHDRRRGHPRAQRDHRGAERRRRQPVAKRPRPHRRDDRDRRPHHDLGPRREAEVVGPGQRQRRDRGAAVDDAGQQPGARPADGQADARRRRDRPGEQQRGDGRPHRLSHQQSPRQQACLRDGKEQRRAQQPGHQRRQQRRGRQRPSRFLHVLAPRRQQARHHRREHDARHRRPGCGQRDETGGEEAIVTASGRDHDRRRRRRCRQPEHRPHHHARPPRRARGPPPGSGASPDLDGGAGAQPQQRVDARGEQRRGGGDTQPRPDQQRGTDAVRQADQRARGGARQRTGADLQWPIVHPPTGNYHRRVVTARRRVERRRALPAGAHRGRVREGSGLGPPPSPSRVQSGSASLKPRGSP